MLNFIDILILVLCYQFKHY